MRHVVLLKKRDAVGTDLHGTAFRKSARRRSFVLRSDLERRDVGLETVSTSSGISIHKRLFESSAGWHGIGSHAAATHLSRRLCRWFCSELSLAVDCRHRAVLCCLPFGVVSIVHAAKVDSLLAQGDIVGANAASKSAKTWAIAGVATWGVGIGIYLIFMVIVAAGAAASSP